MSIQSAISDNHTTTSSRQSNAGAQIPALAKQTVQSFESLLTKIPEPDRQPWIERVKSDISRLSIPSLDQSRLLVDLDIAINNVEKVDRVSNEFKQAFAGLAAHESKFHQTMQQAFGDKYHASIAESLRLDTIEGNFHFLPDVSFLDNDILQQNAGAYSKEYGSVYLNQSLSENLLAAVYTEEVGHHLDTLMGSGDAAGDEGAVFSMLLRGENNPEVQAKERGQLDSGIIVVNGQSTQVEFNDFFIEIGTNDYYDPQQDLLQIGQNQIDFQFNQPNYQIDVQINNINNTLDDIGNSYPSTSNPTTESPPNNTASEHQAPTQPKPADMNTNKVSGQLNDKGELIVNWDSRSDNTPEGSHWLSTGQLIKATYQQYLGRSPNIRELIKHQIRLNDTSGVYTQRQFVENIKNTKEAGDLRQQNIDPQILYYLREKADPALAAKFLNTQVMQSGLTSGEFLISTHQVIFGSKSFPNPQEFAYYVPRIESGEVSRAEVLAMLFDSNGSRIIRTSEQLKANGFEPSIFTQDERLALFDYSNTSNEDFASAINQVLTQDDPYPVHRKSLIENALLANPQGVLNSYAGLEGKLGSLVADRSIEAQTNLLNAMQADPDVSVKGAGQLVTAMFLKADDDALDNTAFRDAMSAALAKSMTESGAAPNQTQEELSLRLNSILASDGGQELLANYNVNPQLRAWAMSEVAKNTSLNADTLAGGWQSQAISEAVSQPIINRFQQRGTASQTLSGEALRNTIGLSLGIQPDQLPNEEYSPEKLQQWLNDGFNNTLYGENTQINDIESKIKELGGENAEVTLMPVTVTSNDFGLANFTVFRVKGLDGNTYLIDGFDPKRHYNGFADWQEKTRLPPGQMTYVEGMDWSAANDGTLTTEATPSVIDTPLEWATKIGDGVALVAGIVAGGFILFGSGGALAPLVGAGAGLYSSGRAGSELYDAHQHGVDISDLTDSEVRANWLDAAAGTLSFGAVGAARVAMAAKGSQSASLLTPTAAGLQLAANAADVAAATNQAYDLATQWDNLSAEERAMGLLNVAFWGGLTAASSAASGGFVGDSFSFTRLQNQIEYGSPYQVNQNPELHAGEMRVVYDRNETTGRTTNIRIEYGGNEIDSNMLAMHSRSARQMEASGGLIDRINRYLTNDEAQIGTAAWEAKFELNKINREAQAISRSLSNPDITPEQKAALGLRQEELDNATAYQTTRLEQLELQGEGWVATPAPGAVEAARRGWQEAPDGYQWVNGANQPYLRRIDASDTTQLYYDPATGNFTENVNKPEMVRVGHGENDVNWQTNEHGQTVEVTATLREFYKHADRSSAELSAQTAARANAIDGDQAGHIIGHRFVRDQGLQNLFPQNANLNTGAYKTLENELADWIEAGAKVELNVKLHDYQNGRPSEIEVQYQVFDTVTGKLTHEDTGLFQNSTNQEYIRVSKSEINSKLEDIRNI